MEKQVDLSGKVTGEEGSVDTAEIGLMKSALQKCIRRGMTEQAMYFALKLAEQSSFSCWRRLSIIADEDVGQPLEIVAVDTLYRKFMAMKKGMKAKDALTWEMKCCVTAAAKILSDAKKDRRADEFLELMDYWVKKHSDKFSELKDVETSFSKVPDEAFDMHTVQGRRMGRKLLYWYEVSSETVNKTPAYEKWHKWFKPLMIENVKRQVKKTEQGSKLE